MRGARSRRSRSQWAPTRPPRPATPRRSRAPCRAQEGRKTAAPSPRASMRPGCSLGDARRTLHPRAVTGGGVTGAGGPGGRGQVESLLPVTKTANKTPSPPTPPPPADRAGSRPGDRPPARLTAPDCGADAAGCDEVRLRKRDGRWSVNRRVHHRFPGRWSSTAFTRATASSCRSGGRCPRRWGGGGPHPARVAAKHNTLYARPERSLLQARRYALGGPRRSRRRLADDGPIAAAGW